MSDLEAPMPWEIEDTVDDDNMLQARRNGDWRGRTVELDRCRYCGGTWHGLKREFRDGSICFGSHQDQPRTPPDEKRARDMAAGNNG